MLSIALCAPAAVGLNCTVTVAVGGTNSGELSEAVGERIEKGPAGVTESVSILSVPPPEFEIVNVCWDAWPTVTAPKFRLLEIESVICGEVGAAVPAIAK